MAIRNSIYNKSARTITLDRDVSHKCDKLFGKGKISMNINKILREYFGI
jgi:predicted acetyltransferase